MAVIIKCTYCCRVKRIGDRWDSTMMDDSNLLLCNVEYAWIICLYEEFGATPHPAAPNSPGVPIPY